MPAKKKAVTSHSKSKVTRKPVAKAVPKSPAARKIAAKPVAAAPARRSRRRTSDVFQGFTPYPLRKGEPYMNENQRGHFRNILLGWKKELMEEVDRTVHHMQDEAANFPDPNDRATQESEFSLELRTRDRERKLIKKIDEALANLEAGEYGYCDSCGVEIGIRRLEARPTAAQCIDCKTLDEIREKQMTG
jgi:RNA polymerase-binding transcription factor